VGSEISIGTPREWNKELDNRLKKELWTFTANRIAVRFAFEAQNASGLVAPDVALSARFDNVPAFA
jgi:nuclear transport factor 2 (NTF2) superfamily protein